MEQGFGIALKSERKRLGYSLQGFAEFLGTSVSSLKRWEAGQSMPTEAHREAIFETIHHSSPETQAGDTVHGGWLLKVERLAVRLSIRQAAEIAKIPPAAWHRYETGQSKLGRTQAERLAALLNAPELGVNALPQADQPANAARILVRKLRSERTHHGRHELLESLGAAMVHLGEHHFSGLAYRLAAQVGKEERLENDILTWLQIGSVWIGFPKIRERSLATARLRWFESKIAGLAKSQQGALNIPRSMFICWAGYPHLAQDILTKSSHNELEELTLAWIEARHGATSLAMRTAERFVQNESARIRFIANKVLLESLLNLGDKPSASEVATRLVEIRSSSGYWSPDLSKRINGLITVPTSF